MRKQLIKIAWAATFGLAISFTFFACSNEADSPLQSDEGPSSPSNNASVLCGNVEYDASVYRCEYGELIGKCNGVDYRPLYQVCNNGRVEDKDPSNPYIPNSTVIPESFEFLGGGYDVINSAYINPNGAIKHRAYPVLNREKMFQDGLFVSTKQPQESFETVAGNTIRETIHNRSLKIGVTAEANLPSFLPFFNGGISVDYENVKNSAMKTNMAFAKLNYHNYKEDLSIKNATKEKLKDYLTDTFKNDLKAKTAAQIIASYGTHIFVQYYRGGSLEANYTYAYDGTENIESVKKAAGATFKGIAVNVSGDISTSTNTSNLAKDENLSFKYESFGGSTIGVGDLAALKSKFQGWATSIKESNAVICGIADFKKSFIPIWDLASAGGFTTEANALKAEFYKNAGNIAFEAARFYKTDIKPITATKNSVPFKYPDGTIAEIEIYALGGGGGGQGGNNNITAKGTGGAGGGGAATYVKLGNLGLKKNDSISLSITIGKGGKGGDLYDGYTTNNSGGAGKKGDSTMVVYKTATIKAYGGFGAGTDESSNIVTGGSYGLQSTLPTSSTFYLGGRNATGTTVNRGGDGNYTSDVESKGGAAMRLNVGTLESFGGGNGALRPKGASPANTTGASNGGGGRGGYNKSNGTDGGPGLVNIVVKYFWEEGGTEAKTENYGTACNSYCKWDTGCYEIRTDPDGRYGEANSTCSAAITNCDYYGLGKYNNATCTGTPLSGTKPQSCGYYCRWDSGCYELKTDPAGLYGTVLTSCTTAISNCDLYGERYSNGDCL